MITMALDDRTRVYGRVVEQGDAIIGIMNGDSIIYAKRTTCTISYIPTEEELIARHKKQQQERRKMVIESRWAQLVG